MTEDTASALPDGDEAATSAPSLLAFPNWLEQNQATIKEPLQKYRGYSDYVKQETLAQGRYSDTLVAKLDAKLAGLAVESGDYALPEGATEYNPADVLARPKSEEIPAKSILNFAFSPDVADDDPLRQATAKYEALRRLRDEGRSTPEELAAAEADLRQLATPEVMSRAVRKDVKEGRSLAAIVPPADPEGRPTLEINDSLLELRDENGNIDMPALGKTLKMHGTDPSLIPGILDRLTRPEGYAKTKVEIERHGEAMSTLDTLARTADPDNRFAVFEELGKIATSRERGNTYATEYGVFNLRRVMGEQAKGKSDAELLTLADDFNRMNEMPEIDEENPAAALRTLSTGQVVAPLNLMLNDKAFEKALGAVPLAQRPHIEKQREYAVEASASDIIRTISDNPQGGDEFVAYMDEQRSRGVKDSEIVKGWIGMGKFSTTKSTLAGLRSSLGEAVMPFVALATGLDPDGFAIGAMKGAQIEDANRRAYADLFGKSHGMVYDLGRLVAPVAVDLGASFLTRGVATGAVAVGKATAGTAVRNVMKTALTAPTRSIMQSWVKAAATSGIKSAGLKVTGRETVDEVVSMAGRDIVSKIGTGVGYGTSIATGFNRSALSTYASLSTALSNQTNPDGTPKYTQEEVREIAMTHGLAAGTITAGVMVGFFKLGAPGMEMVLRRGLTNGQYARIAGRLKKDVAGFGAADANAMIAQFVKQGVTPLFKSPMVLGAVQEGAEEGLDEFMQYFNEARATGDRISIADAAKQAMYAASLGGVMGGTIAGVGTAITDRTTPSPRVEADIRRSRLLEMAAKLESTAPQTAQVFRNYAFQQRALIPQRQQLESDLKAAKTPEARAKIRAKIATLNEQATRSRTEELITPEENIPEADAAEGVVEAPSDAGVAPEGETVAEGTSEAGRRGMPRGFTGTDVGRRMRATRESVEKEFAELVEESQPSSEQSALGAGAATTGEPAIESPTAPTADQSPSPTWITPQVADALRNQGFDPADAPVERLPDSEMAKYPITKAILQAEQSPSPTVSLPEGQVAPVADTGATSLKSVNLKHGGRETANGTVLPPKFETVGKIPGAIDGVVSRVGVEDRELGTGKFFDGKWQEYPFVSVQPKGQAVRTWRFSSVEQAEAFYNWIGDLSDLALTTPLSAKTPAKGETPQRFKLNKYGGVFDTLYSMTITNPKTPEGVSRDALAKLNASPLNGQFVNGVTLAQDADGTPILVSDGLEESIRLTDTPLSTPPSDTLPGLTMPPRKRSLSSMRDATVDKLDALDRRIARESDEDNMGVLEAGKQRLTALLGRIETVMMTEANAARIRSIRFTDGKPEVRPSADPEDVVAIAEAEDVPVVEVVKGQAVSNPPPSWMSQGAIDEALASLKPSGIIALPKSAYADIPENLSTTEKLQYARQIDSWARRANDIRRGYRIAEASPQQPSEPPVGSVGETRDDRGTQTDAGTLGRNTVAFPDVSGVPAFKRFQTLFGTDIQSAVRAGFITEEKSFASNKAGAKSKVTGYSLRDGREFTSAAEAMKAYLSKAPGVSAKQVEISGIKLPEGYVKQGDLYVYQPTTPQTNATQERIVTEDNQREYQAPREGGKTAEAGGGNRPVESGQGEETLTPGTPITFTSPMPPSFGKPTQGTVDRVEGGKVFARVGGTVIPGVIVIESAPAAEVEKTAEQVEARARENIMRLEPEAREKALNNLGEGTPKLPGFLRIQRTLDEQDANAPNMTREEWQRNTYFRSPIALQRWSYVEHRPLTKQEASILNDLRDAMLNQREYAPVTGKRIVPEDWPIVQGGDLPTTMQAENLTGSYNDGRDVRSDFAQWNVKRAAQYDALRSKPTPPAPQPPTISDIIADVPEGYPLDRDTAKLVSAAVVMPGGLLSAMAANPVVADAVKRYAASKGVNTGDDLAGLALIMRGELEADSVLAALRGETIQPAAAIDGQGVTSKPSEGKPSAAELPRIKDLITAPGAKYPESLTSQGFYLGTETDAAIKSMLEGDLSGKKPGEKARPQGISLGDIRPQQIPKKVKIENMTTDAGIIAALKNVASSDTSRYILNSVLFDKENQLLVATDGRMLITVPAKVTRQRIVATNDSAVVKRISKYAKNVDVPKSMKAGAEMEGNYPNWKMVVPDYTKEKNTVTQTWNIEQLAARARGAARAHDFANLGGYKSASFKQGDKTINLSPYLLTDLLEAMQKVGATNVDITVLDGESPVLFNTDNGVMGVLMPIRGNTSNNVIITESPTDTPRNLPSGTPSSAVTAELDKFGFSEGLPTFLANVAKKGGKQYSGLAKLLIDAGAANVDTRLVNLPNTEAAGFYVGANGVVHINTAKNGPRGAVDTVLHELVHAVTEGSLRNPTPAQQKVIARIERVRATVTKRAKANGTFDNDLRYALGDNAEFLTHFFTSQRFRDQVSAMTPKSEKNWLQVIADLIVDLIAGRTKAQRVEAELRKELTTLITAPRIGLAPSDVVMRLPDAGTRFQFAGEKANTPQFMRDSLDTAKTMAAAGKDSEEIRAVTGWFPGKYDGKMRWEIPDAGAKWSGELDWQEQGKSNGQTFYGAFSNAQQGDFSKMTLPLSDFLDHPALYAAYPELKDLPVRSINLKPAKAAYGMQSISIDYDAKPKDALSSILHEIQHWVQEKEGFAKGSSPEARAYDKEFSLNQEDADRVEQIKGKISELSEQKRNLDNANRRGEGGWQMVSRRQNQIQRLDSELDVLYREERTIMRVARDTFGFDAYRRTAGEIEARDVQARANMTPEQLASTAPYSSENIALEDAIVLMGSSSDIRFQPASDARNVARFHQLTESLYRGRDEATAAEIEAWKEANPGAWEELSAMREEVLLAGGWDVKAYRGDDSGRTVLGSTVDHSDIPVVFATSSEKVAATYGNEAKPFFVKNPNPYRYNAGHQTKAETFNVEDVQYYVQEEGRSGAVITDVIDIPDGMLDDMTPSEARGYASDIHVLFDPTQIKSADPISSGPRVTPDRWADAASPDIRFQPAARNTDADYIAAVEAGDMETAQRMVDEAARAAGYSQKVSHGTDEARNLFDGGAYFTDSRRDASAYAELRALKKAVDENDELSEIVGDVLAEMNGEELTDLGPQAIRDIADANGIDLAEANGAVISGYLRFSNPLDITDLGTDVGDIENTWDFLQGRGLLDEAWTDLDEDVQDELRDQYSDVALYRFLEGEGVMSRAFDIGHDVVIFDDISPDGGSSHTSWLTQDANQFKSADPVTYDDAGNVIPLSQRFQSTSPDIRFQGLTEQDFTPANLRDTATGFLPDDVTLDDLTIDFADLADITEGLDPINAENAVHAAVNHALARRAGEAAIPAPARSEFDSDEAFDAATREHAAEVARLTDTYELITRGRLNSDAMFRYRTNPGALVRLVDYLTAAIKAAYARFTARYDTATAVALNRMSRDLAKARTGFNHDIEPSRGYDSEAVMMLPAEQNARSLSEMRIEPPSDNVVNVADANDLTVSAENAEIPVSELIGGVNVSQPSERRRVDALKEKIMSEDGFIARIIVDGQNQVVEGQHRLQALQELGFDNAPVVILKGISDFIPNDLAVKEILKNNGVAPSDARNQLLQNLGEIIADEKGNVAELREYEAPRGYETAWTAAVEEIIRQNEEQSTSPDIRFQPAAQPASPARQEQQLLNAEVKNDGWVDLYKNDPSVLATADKPEVKSKFLRRVVEALVNPFGALSASTTKSVQNRAAMMQTVDYTVSTLGKRLQKAIRDEEADMTAVKLAVGNPDPLLTPSDETRIADNFTAEVDRVTDEIEATYEEELTSDPANAEFNRAVAMAEMRREAERNRKIAIWQARTAEANRRREQQLQALAQLERTAPDTYEAIIDLRGTVNKLQRLAREVNADSPAIQAIIDQSQGVYLVRSFAVHQDPKQIDLMMNSQDPLYAERREALTGFFRDKAYEQIMGELERDPDFLRAYGASYDYDKVRMDMDERAREGAKTRAQVMFEDFMLGHERSGSSFGQGSTVSNEIQRYMAKTNMPQEFLDALMVNEDPVFNLANTAMSLGRLVYNARMLQEIHDSGVESGRYITEAEKESGVTYADGKAEMRRVFSIDGSNDNIKLHVLDKITNLLHGELKKRYDDGTLDADPDKDQVRVRVATALRSFADTDNVSLADLLPEIGRMADRHAVDAFISYGNKPQEVIANLQPRRGRFATWNPLVSANAGNAAFKPLGGLYADPEQVEAFAATFRTNAKGADHFATKALDVANRSLIGMAGASLAIATQGSPSYYVRNIVGNVFYGLINGVSPLEPQKVTLAARAAKSMLSERGEISAEFQELIAGRIVFDAAKIGYLKQLIEDMVANPNATMQDIVGESVNADLKMQGLAKSGKAKAKAFMLRLGKFAEMTEVLSTVMIYADYKNILTEAGFGTEKEIIQEASRLTKRHTPGRSETASGVNAFTRTGFGAFLAPFLRFKADNIRILPNIWMDAMTWSRSENPVLRKAGQRKLAAATATMGLITIALPLIFQRVVAGLGDDEDRAIRASLPEYYRNSSLFYFRNKTNDGFNIVNLTYTNPLSFVGDPVSRIANAVMTGNVQDIPAIMGRFVAEDFIGENIAASNLIDVARNIDSNTNYPIYFEADTSTDKVIKSALHILRSYNPRIVLQGLRFVDSLKREGEQDFWYSPLGVAFATVAPFRPVSVSFDDMERRAFSSVRKENAELWRITSRIFSPAPLAPGDAEEMYEKRTAIMERQAAKALDIYEGFSKIRNGDTTSVERSAVSAGISKTRARLLFNRGVTERLKFPDDDMRHIRQLDPARYAEVIESVRSQPRFIPVER